MCIVRVCVGIAALTSPAGVQGADLPYGADSIPYLATAADVVIEAGESELDRGAERAEAAVYQVAVRKVLPKDAARVRRGPDRKGGEAPDGGKRQAPMREGDRIVVVLPRLPGFEEPPTLQGSVLFLSGPLSREQWDDLKLPADRPAFRVVSGHYGALRGDLQPEVRAYLETAPEERLEWASKVLKKEDALLQRSGVFEIASHVKASPDRAVSLLQDALRSDAVNARNKDVAIQGLGRSGSEKAREVLVDFAREQTQPAMLRESAVKALTNLPESRDILMEWRQSDDELLAPSAAEALNFMQSRAASLAPATEGRIREVQEKLRADEAAERLEGIRAAEQLQPSKEVLVVLKEIVRNPSERMSLRVSALQAIANANDGASAEVLAEIAKDKKQSQSLRTNALVALSRIERGVSSTVLKELATTLDDDSLAKLAAALAGE